MIAGTAGSGRKLKDGCKAGKTFLIIHGKENATPRKLRGLVLCIKGWAD